MGSSADFSTSTLTLLTPGRSENRTGLFPSRVASSCRARSVTEFRLTARAASNGPLPLDGSLELSDFHLLQDLGLVTAVQSLAELRNALGVGHGRAQRIPSLERHTRRAMNASRTVAEFLLATWHQRRNESSS